MKIYLIGIVFILFSCNGQKKTSEQNTKAELKADSSLVLLFQDEYGGFEVAETMVIKDQKRLNSFYSKINRTRKPGLSVPQIDFSKEMVIIQCSGRQNQIAYPSLVMSSETASEILLTVKKKKPTKNASAAITTNPFSVYKMALTDKNVVVKNEF